MKKPHHMLAILAATQLLALPAALAQDATRQPYQLAGAPLDKTLLRIAAESGVALAYDPKLVEAARSAPVSGNFSATEAITRALEGTGFELASGGGRTLTIRRAAAPVAPVRAAPPVHAPIVQASSRQPAAAAAAAPATEAVARVTVKGARRNSADQETDNIQRAPTSSYRVTGDEAEQQNLTTLEDLQQLIPGLVIQSTDPSDTQITIRGVGDGGGQASGDANIGMPSSVAIYVDNVYLARAGMLGNGLGDIAYAEVLSGAQGAAFGANATGGVLNIHTREPSFTPEASATVSIGENGYRRGRAMVSGPLSDSLAGNWAGRLNLVYSNNDGAVTNVRNGHRLNGGSSTGARGQLLFKQGDAFRLRLSADYSNSNSTPTPVLLATNVFSGTDGYVAKSRVIKNNIVFGPQVDLDDENRIHVVQGGASAVADWQLDSGYKLRSVTSVRYFRTNPTMADGFSVNIYNNTGTQVRDHTWSQELRLESPIGEDYDYAVGLNYLGQNLDTVAHTRYAAGTLAGVYYASAAYNNLDVIRFGKLRDHMLSPYAQGTWHIAPGWDLNGGLRFTYEEKSGRFVRLNRVPFNSGNLKEYHQLPSGTLVLKYQLAPEWNTYLAGSYGEKSGGINVSAGAARQAGNDSLYIKPEKTRTAEWGVKGALWDDKVAVKAALFLTEISDFQTQGYNPDDQQTYLMNAGSFRSRGAETSIRAALTRNLQVDFAAVYNDATYTDYDNARCAPEVTLSPKPPPSCDLKGKRVFNAPKVTWNASARYSWRSENGLNNFVGARYAYRGWMYGTVDNSSLTRVSSYGLASFSAGTGGKLQRGDWSASLWVNNAFDKTYYRRLSSGDYGTVWGWLGESRTIGATLAYKY